MNEQVPYSDGQEIRVSKRYQKYSRLALMAAIQALHIKTKELEEKSKQVDELRATVVRLESLVQEILETKR